MDENDLVTISKCNPVVGLARDGPRRPLEVACGAGQEGQKGWEGVGCDVKGRNGEGGTDVRDRTIEEQKEKHIDTETVRQTVTARL